MYREGCMQMGSLAAARSGLACLDTLADFIGENNPEGLSGRQWKDKYYQVGRPGSGGSGGRRGSAGSEGSRTSTTYAEY
jgi:hypothetical protein